METKRPVTAQTYGTWLVRLPTMIRLFESKRRFTDCVTWHGRENKPGDVEQAAEQKVFFCVEMFNVPAVGVQAKAALRQFCTPK